MQILDLIDIISSKFVTDLALLSSEEEYVEDDISESIKAQLGATKESMGEWGNKFLNYIHETILSKLTGPINSKMICCVTQILLGADQIAVKIDNMANYEVNDIDVIKIKRNSPIWYITWLFAMKVIYF